MQLAQMVLDMTGSKSKIERRPLPQDDPVRRCPDISLAKGTLDWEPKVAIEDGLKATIEYFRQFA
jgi:UDP-glucuronate decarboxylase